MTKATNDYGSTSLRLYARGILHDLRLTKDSILELWKNDKFFSSFYPKDNIDKITTSLDNRITNLEDNETIYQLYEFVGSSTSGKITIPEGSSVFDIYEDGVLDAICVQADVNNKPTTTLSVDVNGSTVQVNSLIQSGSYTLSATPTVNSCIVCFVIAKDIYKSNIPIDKIISFEKRVLSISYADFYSNTSNPSYKEGRLFYDTTENCLSYYNNSSDMTLNIGQESVVNVVNKAGVNITNGQVVYISGAQGNRPKVALARANTKDTACNTLGVVTESLIPENNMGYITTHGLVNGLNTALFNEGDTLWLSDATAGLLTNVEPVFSSFKIKVGYCIVSHNSNGKILVTVNTDKNKFGNYNAGNYTEFEDDGTMVAKGTATTFRDELNDALSIQQSGPGVSRNLIEGTLDFTSASDLNDYGIINVQFNHDRVVNSKVYPHIHWFQSSNNTPNWLVQYRLQNLNTNKVTAWTNYRCDENAFTYTSGLFNQISHGYPDDIGILIPGSVSDILQVKIIRDNGNTSGVFAGANTYIGTAQMLSFDIHIECDTLGSRQIYTK